MPLARVGPAPGATSPRAPLPPLSCPSRNPLDWDITFSSSSCQAFRLRERIAECPERLGQVCPRRPEFPAPQAAGASLISSAGRHPGGVEMPATPICRFCPHRFGHTGPSLCPHSFVPATVACGGIGRVPRTAYLLGSWRRSSTTRGARPGAVSVSAQTRMYMLILSGRPESRACPTLGPDVGFRPPPCRW